MVQNHGKTVLQPASLTNSQAEVLEELHGSQQGKTCAEVVEGTKGKRGFSERNVREVIPQLVKMGLVRKTTPEGTKPERFKPDDEYPKMLDDAEVSHRPVPDRLVELTIARALEIIKHIDTNEAWKKPRRIKSICRDEIGPLLDSIDFLRRKGYQIPSPYDYEPFFLGEERLLWKGVLGARNLAGTISIPRPGIFPMLRPFGLTPLVLKTTGKNEAEINVNEKGKVIPMPREEILVNPSLGEWQDYLREVVIGLQKGPADPHYAV